MHHAANVIGDRIAAAMAQGTRILASEKGALTDRLKAFSTIAITIAVVSWSECGN